MTRASLPPDGPAANPVSRHEARLTALVAQHLDFIWRVLRRQGLSPADSDDAAQQTFMIANQKLDDITEGRERSFLYGTALRMAANARRRTGLRREVPAEPLESEPMSGPGPDELVELSRAWSLLDELLAKLPPELARVLALAEIEQIAVAEIAALEAIPAGTAASRLRRAREEFRALLKKADHRNPFAKGMR